MTTNAAKTWKSWLAENNKMLFIIICLLLFILFLFNNYTPAEVWVFGWKPKIPLITIAFACFAIGSVSGWLTSAIYRKRKAEKSQSII